MVDVDAPKGFRARLGLRKSKTSSDRDTSSPAARAKGKRLSKKTKGQDQATDSVLEHDLSGTATPDQNDSGYALSRKSSEISKESDIPDMDLYQNLESIAPHAMRENPYAAVRTNSDLSSRSTPTRSGKDAVTGDYRFRPAAYSPSLAHQNGSHMPRDRPSLPSPAHRDGRHAGGRCEQPPRYMLPPLPQTSPLLPYAQPPDAHQSRNRLQRKAPPNFSRLHQDHKKVIDKDTGERKDLTDMLHAFTYDATLDRVSEEMQRDTLYYDESKPDGLEGLASLSAELWDRVADFLKPIDIARLSITCHALYNRLGALPYHVLRNPANRQDRLDFLLPMDEALPLHLFCHPCASYHLRTQAGSETLKPSNVLNPLFVCPNSTNALLPPPRIRITEGRTLPFTFVQLIKRGWLYSTLHGIPIDALSRRWIDPENSLWSHATRYHINPRNGHVLMRVTSQVYATPGLTLAAKRLLLYSRGDYEPYFSVCAHWRDGVLMDLPKCALDHLPVAKENAITQIQRAQGHVPRATGIVALCGECRPMRRCPKCPSEYLFELKLVEDKKCGMHDPRRFRQALVVTRWSDLGNGVSPQAPEWSAIKGENESYNGIAEIGGRAVSGIFESAFSDTLPPQRILSMNPEKKDKGEAGHGWY